MYLGYYFHANVEKQEISNMNVRRCCAIGLLIFTLVGSQSYGQVTSAISLSPDLPHEVDIANPTTPLQNDFDLFSWKSFVALNWPANTDGTPNKAVTIGQESSARRVWEFYMLPEDVFLSGGSKPTWRSPQNGFGEFQMTKAAPEIQGTFLDALHFPIVDQNKNFVVFGVRLSKDEFDYIVENNLYSKEGQKGPTSLGEKFVSFTSGVNDGPVGAIEIKTAWRVFPLDPVPDPKLLSRYYTREVVLNIPKENSAAGAALKITVKLGLVGFHIAHKTKNAPQWIWSTFEHVDNLAAPDGIKPTFSDPACSDCPSNNKPIPNGFSVPINPEDPAIAPVQPYLWASIPPFASPNQRIPTQIKRLTPIQADPQLNSAWQQKLSEVDKDSVWQYYQLISTQWPTKPFARQPGQKPGSGPGQPSVADYEGTPTPSKLANIPMEVYNQSSSSCIRCHSKAFTTNGDYADFSYLLQLAH
jgi:hypothetical protein